MFTAALIGCGSGAKAPQSTDSESDSAGIHNVSYYINIEASPGTERAVGRAFDAWEASGFVTFLYAGRTKAGIRRDGRNTVSFLLTWPEDIPFGHIAYTALWYDRHGRIIEADIICNMRIANFTTYETLKPDACFVEEVLAHEIGHMLGLGHSENTDSIMHPLFQADADPRSLLIDPDSFLVLEKLMGDSFVLK